MPQLSYFWAVIIGIVYNYYGKDGWGPFFGAVFVIAVWNYIPTFLESFGFVRKSRFERLQQKNKGLEATIEKLREHIDVLERAEDTIEETLKREAHIDGQNAVFEVYLFNQKVFKEHLRKFMNNRDYAFNIKGEPYKKKTQEENIRAEWNRKTNTPPPRKPKPTTDWRKVLEVGETADETTVNLAYRNLVKKHHPDVNKEEGNAERLVALNLAKEEADKFFSRG